MTDNIGNGVPPPIPAANLGSDSTKLAELWQKRILKLPTSFMG